MIPQRGHLYIVNLNPRFGTEPGKTRPVVVIQTDLLNQTEHPSTIVCPLTTKVQKNARLFRIPVDKGIGGLTEDSDILVDQIRAIDNRRFKTHIGQLPTAQMVALMKALKSILDLTWI